jgi:hypothetical protein
MAFEPVRKVISLMAGYPHPWCVCGGWSMDLFAGRETREHGDVEIFVYRRDQAALWQHFAYWSLVKILPRPDDEPVITPWEQSDRLELPTHQIRSYPREETPEFDLMLNERDDDNWYYRRSADIKRSLDKVVHRTSEGIPFLAPEIALLYKAYRQLEKNEHDFNLTHPLLDDDARAWLIQAIERMHAGHAWLAVLRG